MYPACGAPASRYIFMPVHVVLLGRRRWKRRRRRTANSTGDWRRACSKFSVAFDRSSLRERLLEPDEHQVIAARRQRHRAVGGDASPSFNSRIFMTPSSLLISWTSTWAKSAAPPVRLVGRRAVVVDRQIAGADFGALGRRARPGLFDGEIADLERLGERGRGEGRARSQQRACGNSRMHSLLALSASGLHGEAETALGVVGVDRDRMPVDGVGRPARASCRLTISTLLSPASTRGLPSGWPRRRDLERRRRRISARRLR